MHPDADLSVIILGYNTRVLLLDCLATLDGAARAAGVALETIVVDNASVDGSVAALAAAYPAVRVIANTENRGFAAANNQGLAAARAPIVLLLNSDAFVTAAALRRALDLFAAVPRAGIVGVRLTNADGSPQAEWGEFPTFWHDLAAALGLERGLASLRRGRGARREASWSGPVDWVQGACFFVRAAALPTIGVFDERFFMYGEEVDWCRRCWARGWEVWYAGDVAVRHISGASSARDDLRRRVLLYRGRFGLRRRLGGAYATLLLWLGVVVGLGARTVARLVIERLGGPRWGRHDAEADWQLLRAVARMDPLARWARED